MIVWFAWGGTWWHVFPISSLIEFIKDNDKFNHKVDHIYRLGQRWSLENKISDQISSDFDKLSFVKIISGKIRRKPTLRELWKNIVDIFRVWYGVLQSIYAIKKYHIDVIFSKWWYVSLPVCFASKITNTTLIVHESDTHAGISTKIWAKFANKVFLWFEDSIPWWEYIWQILSKDLTTTKHISSSDKTTILVNCGSLGSKTIHQTILDILEDSQISDHFQRKILIGMINQEFENKYNRYDNVEVIWFADQPTMWKLYQQADISICRGWSTTLVEQNLFNIRQIIIPIPWTHDQFDNAEYFVRHHDDILIDQYDDKYEDNLKQVLSHLVWYNKSKVNLEDIKKYISWVKEKICEYIIN